MSKYFDAVFGRILLAIIALHILVFTVRVASAAKEKTEVRSTRVSIVSSKRRAPAPRPKKKKRRDRKKIDENTVITPPSEDIPEADEEPLDEYDDVFDGVENEFIDEAGREGVYDAYIARLVARIQREKFYPPYARRLRHEGIVEIVFTVSKNGAVTGVALHAPSKYGSLNKAALRTIRKIKRFEPLPESLKKNSERFIVPVKYELY